MNKGGPKKDKPNKDLVDLSKKTSSLCKTDLESIGIDIAIKHTIHQVGGHTDDVISVSFSPNGMLLATGSGDHTARIWDVATGRCAHILKGHTGHVSSVCFSPNGKLLATGSYDKTARIWDVATGRSVRVFEGHTSHVKSVRFSLNGKLLATGSYDNTARIWDVATCRCAHVLEGHTSFVTSVCFSPKGKLLATAGSSDHSVRFWNITSGTHLVTFYNLNQGFLWATPPDEKAKSGWFWTDRPDLVHLVRCGENGEEIEVVADDDPERKAYIDACNRQDMVLNRLHHFEKYQAEVDRLVNQNQLQRLEYGLQRQLKALPHPEDRGDDKL